jgi:hypothetical protein
MCRPFSVETANGNLARLASSPSSASSRLISLASCGCSNRGLLLGEVIALGGGPKVWNVVGHAASTNVRARRRPISIGTRPLLVAGHHSRPPHTSVASTSAEAKMRWLDSVFARCSALHLLSFFGGFAGAPVPRPKKALRTRVRPFSLQRAEQNRC